MKGSPEGEGPQDGDSPGTLCLGACVIMAATVSAGENQLGRDLDRGKAHSVPISPHSAARVSQSWLLPVFCLQIRATPRHYPDWPSPRRVRVWPLQLLTVCGRRGQSAWSFIHPPRNHFMSRSFSVPSLVLSVKVQCQSVNVYLRGALLWLRETCIREYSVQTSQNTVTTPWERWDVLGRSSLGRGAHHAKAIKSSGLMAVYPCMSVHRCTCACVQREARGPGWGPFSERSPISCQTWSLTGLEFTKSAKLAGQWAPRVLLSPPHWGWGYKQVLPHLAF